MPVAVEKHELQECRKKRRLLTQVVAAGILILLLACTLPAKAISLIYGGGPRGHATSTTLDLTTDGRPYLQPVTAIPTRSAEEDGDFLAAGTPLADSTLASSTQDLSNSPYLAPGDSPSSTLPVEGVEGSQYPGPGSAVFPTSTPGSNLPYPGQGTAVNPPNLETFATATPPSETAFPVPSDTPVIATQMQTAIPAPAWVNSGLRASDLSQVKLISGKVQLFFFFAFWDGASLAMAPLVQAVEGNFRDQVNFIYVDIDSPQARYFKDTLGYKSQPHFFLVDPQGVVIREWKGYVRIEDLITAIQSALG